MNGTNEADGSDAIAVGRSTGFDAETGGHRGIDSAENGDDGEEKVQVMDIPGERLESVTWAQKRLGRFKMLKEPVCVCPYEFIFHIV